MGINISHPEEEVSRPRWHTSVRASQVLFLHLQKKLLLSSGYPATRSTLMVGDAIS